MDRDAADAFALFDDQNLLAELGRLNGAAAPRRSAADHDKIKFLHAIFPSPRIIVRCTSVCAAKV